MLSSAQVKVSIKGTLKKPIESSYLLLYKMHNVFSSELIDKIDLTDNDFYISKTLDEIDVYYIENPISEQLIRFIWDGDLKIEIDSSNFYSSQIKNSVLTDSLNFCETEIQERFFEPIRSIDNQIKEYKKTNQEVMIINLSKKRDSLIDKSKIDFNDYIHSFVKKNPNSFISLYYLTKMGEYDDSNKDDRTLLFNLSPALKRHTRFKNNY